MLLSHLRVTLIDLANKLDKRGAYNEADELDALVKKMASLAHYNAFVRALKQDDLDTAKNLMSHLSPSDLGLIANDYKDLMIFLKNKDLDRARGLLGIIKGNPDADLGRPTVSPDLKDVFVPSETEKVLVEYPGGPRHQYLPKPDKEESKLWNIGDTVEAVKKYRVRLSANSYEAKSAFKHYLGEAGKLPDANKLLDEERKKRKMDMRDIDMSNLFSDDGEIVKIKDILNLK